MQTMNVLGTEEAAILAFVVGTATSTPLITEYVNQSKNFNRFLAIAMTKTIDDAETLDVAIYKASDASATGAASLKAATQRAAHATNNDDIAIAINLRQDECDEDKSFLAVRAVTSSTTGGDMCLLLLGLDPRYDPGSDYDEDGVVELKN